MTRTLSAPVTVAFDYTRSTGPVLGRFLSGLRDARLVGGRTSDGRVVVPPPEFDPVTHAALDDFVEVAPTGTVVSWAWVPEPVKGQPFDRPFAFALVQPDGADVPMLHALDVPSPDQVTTGMRVQVRWRAERVGAITDIVCWEPVTDSGGLGTGGSVPSSTTDPVAGIVVPVSLDYLYAASPEESAFYRGLNEGRILGVPAAEVRMGMRVRAVWKPQEEWTYSLENIDHFEPTGDPDADYDTYKHHL